jgi:hypothetical protein
METAGNTVSEIVPATVLMIMVSSAYAACEH